MFSAIRFSIFVLTGTFAPIISDNLDDDKSMSFNSVYAVAVDLKGIVRLTSFNLAVTLSRFLLKTLL